MATKNKNSKNTKSKRSVVKAKASSKAKTVAKSVKIALIGFGDLVTSPKGLSKVAGKFQTGGPELPIEFSRISGDGRLTAVIDEAGTLNKTHFAVAKTGNLDTVIKALAIRSGLTNPNRVGFINLKTNQVNQRAFEKRPRVCEAVAQWARSKGFQGVVYLDLSRKFKDAIGVPFSGRNALRYVETLNNEKKKLVISQAKASGLTTDFTEYLKANS